VAAPNKIIIKAGKTFFIHLPHYPFPVIGIRKTGTPEPAAPAPNFSRENITFFILFQEKCFAAVDDTEAFFTNAGIVHPYIYWGSCPKALVKFLYSLA
jgi:hypothetical protein